MKVTKAVIPAAGLGTRFLPAAKDIPKEMLPVVDKPAIHYVVEEAVQAGCDYIVIVTGRGKEAIERYFTRAPELEAVLKAAGRQELLEQISRIGDLAEIAFKVQKQPLGFGHAVMCARREIGNDPFYLMTGDDIIIGGTPCAKQLGTVWERFGRPVVAVQEVPPEMVSRYGIVSGVPINNGTGRRLFNVTGLVEKPTLAAAPSRFAIMGRYLLPPEIFRFIGRKGAGGEIQLTDAIDALNAELPADKKFIASEFDGTRYDLGDKTDWLIANIELGLIHPEVGNGLASYLKGQRLENALRQRFLHKSF
jgi:UTP--glucose-1-phosphate uridylyltransferase